MSLQSFLFLKKKATDISSWLFGGTLRCRKHFRKRQSDEERRRSGSREAHLESFWTRVRQEVLWSLGRLWSPVAESATDLAACWPRLNEMVLTSELIPVITYDSNDMVRTAPPCARRPTAPHWPAGVRVSHPVPRPPTRCSPSTRRRGSACRLLPPQVTWCTWAGRWRWANRRPCWCYPRPRASGTSLSNLRKGSEWHKGLKKELVVTLIKIRKQPFCQLPLKTALKTLKIIFRATS